jgi:type III restriction enzyme
VQAEIVREVTERYRPSQLEFEGVTKQPDIAKVVERTAELVIQQTINIPRILVIPKGEVRSGFKGFTLELLGLGYATPSDELWIQHLRTHKLEVVGLGEGGVEEKRLEDYIVSGLMDFDDVSYGDHADMLYDLAGQAVRHFLGYLSREDTRKVLRLNQREIARFIHAQMLDHFWEETVEYEMQIKKGFTDLKDSAYSASANEPPLDFRVAPQDKSNIKMATQMKDADVLAKRDSAVKWCKNASDHARTYDGKQWKYLLIPHDVIAENLTLEFLAQRYAEF